MAKTLFGKEAFLVLLFGALFLLPFGANQYYLFIGNFVLIFIILALGLNVLFGFAGQLAFANAAMYGIGAYGTGLLMKHFGIPYFLAAPAGAFIAMGIGTLLALPALRLSGIYLALATVAFAQFVLWVMMNWTPVTFGAGGFVPPAVSFAPLPVKQPIAMYFLTWIVTVVMFFFARNAMQSSIGRAFTAIRDNEVAAQALGVDLFRYKVMAFAISGFFAGTAGALYTGVLGFVGPESFDLLQMVIQKASIVLGGVGSIMGAVVGGLLLTIILEVVKEIKFSIEIAFGTLLLLFVLFQPSGLVVFFRRWLPGWRETLHYVPDAEEGATTARKEASMPVAQGQHAEEGVSS